MIGGSSIAGAGVAGDASAMRTLVIRLQPMNFDFDMPAVVGAGGGSVLVTPMDSNFDMPALIQQTVTFIVLAPIDSDFAMPDLTAAGGARIDLFPMDSIFEMPDIGVTILVAGVPDFTPDPISGDVRLTIKNRGTKTVQIFRTDRHNRSFAHFDFVQADTYTDATVIAGNLYKYKLRFVGRFEGAVVSTGTPSISKFVQL